MKIDSIMVGPIMTNCYLLSDETAGVCALIDPGDEAPGCWTWWPGPAANCSISC
ncbi:MAG: hypothetical protein ACLR5H_09310 [Oscillospiraceae bacterium]